MTENNNALIAIAIEMLNSSDSDLSDIDNEQQRINKCNFNGAKNSGQKAKNTKLYRSYCFV